jgi:hypothetical protein
MSRLRLIAAPLLLALVLSACGGTPASTPTGSGAATASAPASAAGEASAAAESSAAPAASAVADLVATAQALANDPTAIANLQATVLAQKPTTDGCDPSMQNVNADSSTLQASWTADNQINLKGELDAPEDTDFFVFVYNNGAPIYWANFPEIKPNGKSWDFTTTTPSPDDLVLGELSRQNPYTPDSKICVGVTGLKGDVSVEDLTDPSKAMDAVLVQLKLPVGGAAPAAIVMPTVNPAGGVDICTDSAELPVAKFKQIAPLLEGAYADALKGAQAWQSDARLYEMTVSCAILGNLNWEFKWLSDSAKKATSNTAREPKPDESFGPNYEDIAARKTIDPTAVTIKIDQLGDAIIGAGYAEDSVVGVLGGITLSEATKDNFLFQTPEGGADGPYYQVSIQVNPDDLGERVLVDATSGKVYKP